MKPLWNRSLVGIKNKSEIFLRVFQYANHIHFTSSYRWTYHAGGIGYRRRSLQIRWALCNSSRTLQSVLSSLPYVLDDCRSRSHTCAYFQVLHGQTGNHPVQHGRSRSPRNTRDHPAGAEEDQPGVSHHGADSTNFWNDLLERTQTVIVATQAWRYEFTQKLGPLSTDCPTACYRYSSAGYRNAIFYTCLSLMKRMFIFSVARNRFTSVLTLIPSMNSSYPVLERQVGYEVLILTVIPLYVESVLSMWVNPGKRGGQVRKGKLHVSPKYRHAPPCAVMWRQMLFIGSFGKSSY